MGKRHKQFAKIIKSASKKIIDELELPRDVCEDAGILTVTGGNEALLENHKGIICFEEDKIICRVKPKQICFKGKNLKLRSFNDSDCLITGDIIHISFGKGG